MKQADKGRPAKAAAAAYLAKTYLYKAYHQDNADSHEVTSLSTEDLVKVVQYTDNAIMSAGGYGLESDFHNPSVRNLNMKMAWNPVGHAILHERRYQQR